MGTRRRISRPKAPRKSGTPARRKAGRSPRLLAGLARPRRLGPIVLIGAALGAVLAAFLAGYWSGRQETAAPAQRPSQMAERAPAAPPAPPRPEARRPETAPEPREQPRAQPQQRPAPRPEPHPAPPPAPRQAEAPARPMTAPVPQPEENRDGLPAWQRFAAHLPPGAEGRPMVAIVLDDVGPQAANAARAIALPAPVTLAFLPYAEKLSSLTGAARRNGHEILVHLPMEPLGQADPGPHALRAGLGRAELLRRLDWNLARFEGYVGVNNHMGSRLTADAAAMEVVLAALKGRGLLFLDSRTTPDTVAGATARRLGLPTAERNVFLDNVIEAQAIGAQLAEAEARARRNGAAVAIGHPHPATLDMLEAWLRTASERGIAVVPLSAIISRRASG